MQFNTSLAACACALALAAFAGAQVPTNNTASADWIEYQFNAVRGSAVANTASTTRAPAEGTAKIGVAAPNPPVPTTTWQGAGQGTGFMGNEPGFGALKYTNIATGVGSHFVTTGWSGSYAGSLTFMFWLKPSPAAAADSTPFGYVWGGEGLTGDNQTRMFTGGITFGGRSITYRRNATNPTIAALTFDAHQNIFTGLGDVWQHLALVIDDTAGVATWYYNGAVDNATSFPPGALSFNKSAMHVARHALDTDLISSLCAIDDFRMYTRAVSPTEVLAAMFGGESPTAGEFGTACAGPTGAPTIGASGGAPAIGNLGFTVQLANMEPFRPTALHIGVQASLGGALPLDVSFLLGAGCGLETLPIASIPVAQNGSGSVPVSITPGTLHGLHAYAQGIVLGTTGAVTRLLDINVE